MKLSLKDNKQASVVAGTTLTLIEGILAIKNGEVEKTFRLANNEYSSGNYWVDAFGKMVVIELFYTNGEFAFILSVAIKDFEILFPNAGEHWGQYYFELHYSRF